MIDVIAGLEPLFYIRVFSGAMRGLFVMPETDQLRVTFDITRSEFTR
jgi:hypothetical protein